MQLESNGARNKTPGKGIRFSPASPKWLLQVGLSTLAAVAGYLTYLYLFG